MNISQDSFRLYIGTEQAVRQWTNDDQDNWCAYVIVLGWGLLSKFHVKFHVS